MDAHNKSFSASRSDIEKANTIEDDVASSGDAPMQQPDIEGSQPVSEKRDTSQLSSLTDWNGDNDPDNPYNWSLAVRVYHVIIPGLFGFAV
jgi:hypothetical protein